jgi:NADPH:quinone reductase-like Zn-dependent oxidoreductase
MVADIITQVLLSWFVSQKLRGFLAKARQEDLAALHDLMTSGKVTPVIDRCFPLSDVSEAIRYLEAGHARGKVIITVG